MAQIRTDTGSPKQALRVPCRYQPVLLSHASDNSQFRSVGCLLPCCNNVVCGALRPGSHHRACCGSVNCLFVSSSVPEFRSFEFSSRPEDVCFHLGNVRASFTQPNGGGFLAQEIRCTTCQKHSLGSCAPATGDRVWGVWVKAHDPRFLAVYSTTNQCTDPNSSQSPFHKFTWKHKHA